MRTSVLLALIALSMARPAVAQGIDEDDKAIRAVVNVYFRGHATANADTMRASFHPTAHIEGIRNGAAMVKATLKHGATTFTDYFVLLKVDGNWRIANKVYHAAR